MDIVKKGLEGEIALNSWFQENGLSYLYVDQSTETFSTMFQGSLKRPDFLVLLDSVGLIAVDAKNKRQWEGMYSLGFDSEFQKALAFERIFRIPLWYAYKGERDGADVWYWVSALKAMEVGHVKTNSSSGEQFLVIPLEEFEEIKTGRDIGKLYTHRMDKVSPKIETRENEYEIIRSGDCKIEKLASIDVGDVYEAFSSYDIEKAKSVMFWLEHDVEFLIHYGEEQSECFSTLKDFYCPKVVAVVDVVSREVMSKVGNYSSLISAKGRKAEADKKFVFDHLLYVVSEVLLEGPYELEYELILDDGALTPSALAVIEDIRKNKVVFRTEYCSPSGVSSSLSVLIKQGNEIGGGLLK